MTHRRLKLDYMPEGITTRLLMTHRRLKLDYMPEGITTRLR
jgi:hypothetical protein